MSSTPSHGSALKDFAYCDLHRELKVTRTVLDRLPEDKFGWRPHAKSMTLAGMGMHVATMPEWVLLTIRQDSLDMANPPKIKTEPSNKVELLKTFDDGAAATVEALGRILDSELERTWSLKQGDQVIYSATKNYVLRVWCVNHLIHHRGQLALYLRLLNVPVPAVYFNSSDEPDWVFE